MPWLTFSCSAFTPSDALGLCTIKINFLIFRIPEFSVEVCSDFSRICIFWVGVIWFSPIWIFFHPFEILGFRIIIRRKSDQIFGHLPGVIYWWERVKDSTWIIDSFTSCFVLGIRFGSERRLCSGFILVFPRWSVLDGSVCFLHSGRKRAECRCWKMVDQIVLLRAIVAVCFSDWWFLFTKDFPFFPFFVGPCHDARKRILFYDKIRQFSFTFYFDNKDFFLFSPHWSPNYRPSRSRNPFYDPLWYKTSIRHHRFHTIFVRMSIVPSSWTWFSLTKILGKWKHLRLTILPLTDTNTMH